MLDFLLSNKYCKSLTGGFVFFLLLSAGNYLSGQSSVLSGGFQTNCPRSQKQADIWCFGDRAGIDFRSGTAVPISNNQYMRSFKSSAVMSDSLGNLLLFTDGKCVFDRTFDTVQNARALFGDLGVEQPCLIVPAPGNPDKYYIFTIDVMAFLPNNSFTTQGFNYTIIDMTMWGGTGDVRNQSTDMNIQLLPAVCQKLTGVKHANGIDYWVIVHEWNSDAFYAYLVDGSGINSPVVSHADSIMGGGYSTQRNAYGWMKASPDGSKIGLAVSGLKKVQIFDFNNTTGAITNPQTYQYPSSSPVSPYGVEFSPDSKLFYVTLLQLAGNGPPVSPSRIYQFNLASGLNAPVLLDTIPLERVGGMQLAPDGRIYIARTVNALNTRDSLDVIYNPTRLGKECNYNTFNHAPKSRFALNPTPPNNKKVIFGLPNFIQSYFNIPYFRYDSVCHHDVTRFSISNTANVDTVFWQFGDGATSTSMNPVHIYSQPGVYTVKLTETYNGINFTDSTQVTVHPLPPVELGDTILLYSGASIVLHAGGGYTQYIWSTGSSDSLITVDKGGDYVVQVKDVRCCYNSDTVYVNLFRYYVPLAFSPNGDGKNDVFHVIGKYQNIALELYIYDRWGQLVFTSNKLSDGWDGTSSGQVCPAGTYVWIANVKFLGTDIITKGDVVYKGTVTLLR